MVGLPEAWGESKNSFISLIVAKLQSEAKGEWVCKQSAWKSPISSVCSNCVSCLLSMWLYTVLGTDKGGKPTRLSRRNKCKLVSSFFFCFSEDICPYLEGKVLNQEVRRNPFVT